MTQWVRQCDVRVLVHNHRQDSFRYTVNLDADRIGQIRGRADTLTKCSMLQNAKLRWVEGSKYVVDANMTNLADNVVSSARCAAVCGAWEACNRGAPHVSYATLYLQELLRCRDLQRRADFVVKVGREWRLEQPRSRCHPCCCRSLPSGRRLSSASLGAPEPEDNSEAVEAEPKLTAICTFLAELRPGRKTLSDAISTPSFPWSASIGYSNLDTHECATAHATERNQLLCRHGRVYHRGSRIVDVCFNTLCLG